MKIRSVGVIGYGHFGAFVADLCARFVPEAEVRVFSRRAEIDNQTFFSIEDAAVSDVVILCGSIREYEVQLELLLPHLGADSIVVDIATVKQHPGEVFKKHMADRKWLSCHPMFGPESYKKTNGDVSGYRIVMTDHTLEEGDYKALSETLTRLGFLIIEMTAAEHDKLLAETLFLTHYIGQTMAAADFKRTAIDTVSFNSLMNAVETVMHDKKLFEDVYRFNPYCTQVAKRFHDAQEEVFTDLPKM